MENNTEETPFDNKVSILAELWLNYRTDEEWADFIDYNDLGLPLAYLLESEVVDTTPRAKVFVEETFALLLASLDLNDTGFESLDEVFDLDVP